MKSLNILIIIIFFLTFNLSVFSQDYNFTKQDTLRGSITPERAWWDLVYYHLDISVNPDELTQSFREFEFESPWKGEKLDNNNE